jgi:hypothetical protein
MFADPDGNEYWLNEDEDLRPKPRKAAAKKAKAAKKKAPAKRPAKKAGKKSAKKARR